MASPGFVWNAELLAAQLDIDDLLFRSYIPGESNSVFWKIYGLDVGAVVQLYNLYAKEWHVMAEIDQDSEDGGFLYISWQR